jgi:hypothetical protein
LHKQWLRILINLDSSKLSALPKAAITSGNLACKFKAISLKQLGHHARFNWTGARFWMRWRWQVETGDIVRISICQRFTSISFGREPSTSLWFDHAGK